MCLIIHIYSHFTFFNINLIYIFFLLYFNILKNIINTGYILNIKYHNLVYHIYI